MLCSNSSRSFHSVQAACQGEIEPDLVQRLWIQGSIVLPLLFPPRNPMYIGLHFPEQSQFRSRPWFHHCGVAQTAYWRHGQIREICIARCFMPIACTTLTFIPNPASCGCVLVCVTPICIALHCATKMHEGNLVNPCCLKLSHDCLELWICKMPKMLT